MNEVWNLDPIYKGFDDPAFAADMEKLSEKAQAVSAFAAGLPGMDPLTGLKEGIRHMEELSQLTAKLAEYASLRQSTNTRDPECGSRLGVIFQILSSTAGPRAVFNEWAAGLPDLDALAAQDDILKEYAYFFRNLKQDATHLLGAKGEEICARLDLSGGSAWADLQGYLTSTVAVDYNGGVTNLSAIRNLAYDPDPAVRKAAYEAELACYGKIKDPVAHALNAIKMETISDCALRGFESPLARTLEHSRMKKETLDAMLGAMDEYLPKFWQYLKAKGKALGHENGLPWYDLFAPMGSSSTKYTTGEARDLLVELFTTFDRELADMVARAFDEAWIDFYPRDGKSGGAFCAGVECLNQSRILTNFDGMFGDVVTLAHELGHAFHNQCIQNHRPLNKDYSMPVAETASTFNECVVMAAAIKNAASDEEKLALIESQLQDATQCIC
ncbi:MAG: peptidase M3, partial [Clostridia bacterium]|nr:peptidase M3 [Clostridia bacterium]